MLCGVWYTVYQQCGLRKPPLVSLHGAERCAVFEPSLDCCRKPLIMLLKLGLTQKYKENNDECSG